MHLVRTLLIESFFRVFQTVFRVKLKLFGGNFALQVCRPNQILKKACSVPQEFQNCAYRFLFLEGAPPQDSQSWS